MTRRTKILFFATASGILIQIIPFVTPFLMMYGAGVFYGLATSFFLFSGMGKRFIWILISSLSYFVAAGTTLSLAPVDLFPEPRPIELLLGGLVGALILAGGYACLVRRVLMRMLLLVILGGVVAAVAGIPGHVFIVWPLWQFVITYELLYIEQEVKKTGECAM